MSDDDWDGGDAFSDESFDDGSSVPKAVRKPFLSNSFVLSGSGSRL
jgi:hypothetical protein